MQAAIEGGFKIAEFTLTTPGCLDTLADFRAKYDGDVMVGCGTIMNTTDAEAACDAGAEFIITPVLVPEVVEWCVQRDIVIIPGCQTPTEAYNAYKLGAPLQKIFPGVAGAHAWVKAVSAALPMLRLNPTSGVDLDNAGDFLKNGAASVGLVAPLFRRTRSRARSGTSSRRTPRRSSATSRRRWRKRYATPPPRAFDPTFYACGCTCCGGPGETFST